MRALRPVLPLALTTLAVGAGPAATAGATTPVRVVPMAGRSAGVTLVRDGRAVLLTSALARHARRGTVDLSCRKAFGAPDSSTGVSGVGRPVLPRRALTIPRGHDYCVVTLTTVRGRSTTTRPIAGVALNAAGAESLYELAVGQYMLLASLVPDDGSGLAPTPELLASAFRTARVLGRPLTLVPTSAPDTPVAVDQVGLFRRGTRSSVTATTPGGRHLYFDTDPAARALSTNVFDAIDDEILGTSETESSGRR